METSRGTKVMPSNPLGWRAFFWPFSTPFRSPGLALFRWFSTPVETHATLNSHPRIHSRDTVGDDHAFQPPLKTIDIRPQSVALRVTSSATTMLFNPR
jgi:hypothetical protein